MLRKRKSVIASFVEHLLCSNFKLYSFLILVFLFWFSTIHLKCFLKSHFFLRFYRSSDIASFVEQAVCSNFKMYINLILFFIFYYYYYLFYFFWFANIYWKWMCKSQFFEILGADTKVFILIFLNLPREHVHK